MTMHKALDEAMHRESADNAMSSLNEQGMWIVDEDTMSRAVHDVYCGIMADHTHPSEKDREQARQLIASISGSPATS